MNLTALDRHCPKCQANARDRWLEARRQQLLPSYVHVVFTLPHELVPLALQNERIFYSLLLQTSADTLLEIARDPRHLGAEIGFFSVLHTWNQKLELHPHAHCVVPAGGLSLDRSHWIQARSAFCLPVKVLSRVFRGKFLAALQENFRQGKLGFHGPLKPLAHPQPFAAWRRTLFRHHWHVYSKPPFAGAEQALRYLGHSTHRVAISNHRLVSLVDHTVTFRWRDSAHNHLKPQPPPLLLLASPHQQALYTLRVLNPAIPFPSQGKTLLPHHPDHPDSPFSSSSNCSRGASHSPQPIEFA